MTTNRATVRDIRTAADRALAGGTPMQCFEWSTMRHIAKTKRQLDVELILVMSNDTDDDVRAVAEAVAFAGTIEIVGNAVRVTR